MKKPNLYVVGAGKCGTTSIYHYLLQHKDVYLSTRRKELNYFSTKYMTIPFQGPGGEDFEKKDLIFEIDQYEDFFSGQTSERVIADISPMNMIYYGCAKDIYAYNPEAKIVMILRNPVDRAFSTYMHLRKTLKEDIDDPVEAILKSSERKEQNYIPFFDYVGVGKYSSAVNEFITVFGRENVKIFFFEDFKEDPNKIMEELCEFAEIEKIKFDTSEKFNMTGEPKNRFFQKMVLLCGEGRLLWLKKLLGKECTRKISMIVRKYKNKNLVRKTLSEEQRKVLYPVFEEDIHKLEQILSIQIDGWKV